MLSAGGRQVGGMLRRVTRNRVHRHIRHVAAVAPDRAPVPVRAVFDQVERDFGMLAPPVILHAPAPEALAATWLMLRETLLASGATSRAAREAVAVAVSRANTCPYCVAVHGTALHGLLPARQAAAAADGQGQLRLPGDTLRPTGWPAGAEAAARAELTGTAVTFQYLNRMVNVFLVASPFPSTSRSVAGLLGRVAGSLLGPVLRRPVSAGGSLALLPDAPVPPDLDWAAARPVIETAFARATAAVEAAGRRSLPPAVRELVSARLAGWDGRPPGPSAGWVDDHLDRLPASERPAGRLALLTAFSSYQVADSVVAGFRRYRPDDRSLIEAAGWASLTAARRWAAG